MSLNMKNKLVMLLGVTGMAASICCLLPGVATAGLVTSFTAGVLVDENTANPQPSDYATQAGGHPDVAFTKFALNTSLGSAEAVRVDLPPGLTVNPQAIPKCSATGTTLNACASDTQVGTSTITVANVPLFGTQTATGAVYNMAPPKGSPADYAFQVTIAGLITIRVDLVGGVRYHPSGGQSGDYGDYFTISEISNLLGTALEKSELKFWGAPEEHNGGGAPNNAFLTNPTACAGPQTTHMSASTYAPVNTGTASYTTPVGTSGCASVPFAPTVAVTPSTTKRDTPDGLTLDIHVPQDQKPADIATSHLSDATVTLPSGMSINPAAAVGLQACTDAQFGAGTTSAITCPASSIVGTAEINTPILATPLTGSLYVGQPQEGNPYRVFLDAGNASDGVDVRFVGSIVANASTGQLTADFSNNPQVPFTDLKLTFKTGANALIANPLGCGLATTSAILSPYSSNAPATPTSSFAVDDNGAGAACPKPLPFAASGEASVSSTTAGASPNLTLHVARVDGEQTLANLSTVLPEGLLANLSNVTLCPEPQAGLGTCTSASQIGTTTVTAGAGPSPLQLSGTVYLTGPYNGSPFGLSVVVPAIAGPYDLGTVVVRGAVALDTVHGQVSIVTDPLPTILQGIPLRLKSVSVAVNKSGFLVNPANCDATAITGAVNSTGSQTQSFSSPLQFTGCEALKFAPTFSATPTSTQRDSPTGLAVDVHLPANSPTLSSALLALPAGLSINPGLANGLQACTDAQLGAGTNNPVTCPAASAVGTVEIHTPLLSTPLTGSAYIGQPLSDEPESGQEYRLFLDAENEADGISVRLVGSLKANTSTGQLTASFANTPPIPFTDLRINLEGGARAPLANSPACGAATLTGMLTPSVGAVAELPSAYTVDANGEGEACAATQPFDLSQSAQSTPATGAAATTFTLRLARTDGQQYLSRLTTTLAPGLLGKIASVAPCPEAEASAGSCPAGSQVGAVEVAAGSGATPLELPGTVYLTGPYEGAPFGLSIAVPAEAVGPFDFGTIVTRAKIAIDEHTAQVSVSTDPLPTIVGAVPLRIKELTINVSRNGFMLNPTDCTPSTIATQLSSSAGAAQAISTPFAASECGSLPFSPSIASTTSVQSSKATGVGFHIELDLSGAHEANIASIATTLPTQLPARLSTLQKACPQATFAASPGSCPQASLIGEASVDTPILPGPMSGPAYLVANGGGAFPDLYLNLAGDGVRIVLHGHTDIKNGLTTVTFPAVPDVPVSRVSLSLPQGPNSALSANGALCGETLTMPSTITAHNGKQLTLHTSIAVTGCASAAGTRAGLTRLKLAPSRFAAAAHGASVTGIPRAHRKRGRPKKRQKKTGTILSYTDTQAAVSNFVVLRQLPGETRGRRCLARSPRRRHHGRRCVRLRRVGSFTHRDRAGANRFQFTGRLGGRKLHVGSYRLEAAVTLPAGALSAPVGVRFWIVGH